MKLSNETGTVEDTATRILEALRRPQLRQPLLVEKAFGRQTIASLGTLNVERDFTAERPNSTYVGDITYLPLASGGNLYVATVIDCFSRRITGWAIADHMRTSLVEDALHATDATRGSLAGAIFHSDHRSVYTPKDFARTCRELGVMRPRVVGKCSDGWCGTTPPGGTPIAVIRAVDVRERPHGRYAGTGSVTTLPVSTTWGQGPR